MEPSVYVFVDAGFREGDAGLGVWIPFLGTGVAMSAKAQDNNEAERLAIQLGLLVGHLMSLRNVVVLTDSKASVAFFSGRLLDDGVDLQWRRRDVTNHADFFATLGLNGKSLVARTSNGKNPEEKFRALKKIERNSKEPLKDVTVRWLRVPNPPRTEFALETAGLANAVPGFQDVLGSRISREETRVLVEEFFRRRAVKRV